MPTTTEAVNIPVLAAQVCNHLGLGWTVLPETDQRYWAARINDSTGNQALTLVVQHDMTKRRISIFPVAPRPVGHYHYTEARPTITVAETATPKAIASHITRRLLDDAQAYWTAALAWSARLQAELGQKQALIDELAALPGTQAGHTSFSTSTVHGPNWRADVYSADSLSLTFSSLTAGQARCLLNAFHAT